MPRRLLNGTVRSTDVSPGVTEENHENTQNSQCLRRDSNQVHPNKRNVTNQVLRTLLGINLLNKRRPYVYNQLQAISRHFILSQDVLRYVNDVTA